MDTVCIIGILALGFVLGVWVATMLFHSNSVGCVRADIVDPESGPSLFIELDREPIDWQSMNYVIFKVNITDNRSQKEQTLL